MKLRIAATFDRRGVAASGVKVSTGDDQLNPKWTSANRHQKPPRRRFAEGLKVCGFSIPCASRLFLSAVCPGSSTTGSQRHDPSFVTFDYKLLLPGSRELSTPRTTLAFSLTSSSVEYNGRRQRQRRRISWKASGTRFGKGTVEVNSGFAAVLSISKANQGSRQTVDKRTRTEEKAEAKRRKIESGEAEAPIYATEFSKEEIENEERRPKKKCAVLLGYSGTGYSGMQLYVLPRCGAQQSGNCNADLAN